MKAEYAGNGGFPQRNSVEHKEYAEAYSAETQKAEERDGADLLEKVLDRDNLNRAYRRVKANKGASGVDGMTVDEALPWLKKHREELLESIRNDKYKPSPVRRAEIPKDNGDVRMLQCSDKSSNRAFPVFPDGKTVDFSRRYQRNRGLLRGLPRGLPRGFP